MKISKVSVIVLLLLIGVIALEVNYFNKKTESSGTKMEESKPSKPSEENLTRIREQEDQKILKTVDAYEKGYRDGCPVDAKMGKTIPVEDMYKRSYILGFQKGKKVCSAKREEQKEKENYKKGEEDGCSTATGKPVQNKALYLKKGSYQKGWDKGYKGCKNQKVKKSEKAEEPKPAAIRINRKSPEYQKGYRQGCDASEGSYGRDENLYLQSKEYRAGWTEGREKCNSRRGAEKKRVQRYTESQLFDQGYRDGCESADGYFRRDRSKYERYTSYREGWRRGERECRRREADQIPPPPPAPLPPFGF